MQMRVSYLIAILSSVLISAPCCAADGWIELGPKQVLSDPRYHGVVLKSAIPTDFSYLAGRYDPNPPFEVSDPRRLISTPSLGDPPQFTNQAESIYLNSVVLSDNGVLGALPKLQEAWIVTFKAEQLPQSLLDALGTDPSLRTLVIRGNVSALDLSVLQHDQQLETLTLSDPHLSVHNIDQLVSIKSLKCLEVQSTDGISADCILQLGKLKQLCDLRLGAALPIDCNLSGLRGLPNLRRLQIVCEAKNLEEIGKLTQLQVLRIDGANTDFGISYLSSLKKLVFLQLAPHGGNWRGMRPTLPTGKTLDSLRRLNLKYLDVSECGITLDGFRSLSKIKSLKGLDISLTKPSREGLMSLASLSNLRNLRASCIGNYDALGALSDKLPLCTIQAHTNCPHY
jgi:hypothetical protein